MAEEDDDAQPKKGRSNAILTYEKLAELTERSIRTEMLVKALVDNDKAKSTKIDKNHEMLEARIHLLELAVGTTKGVHETSMKTWLFIWGALISLPTSISAIVNVYRMMHGN